MCIGKGVNGLYVWGEKVRGLSVFWENQIQRGGREEGVSVCPCAGGGRDLGHSVFKGERSVDCAVCLRRSGSFFLIASLGWRGHPPALWVAYSRNSTRAGE